ncbi:MAG: NAD(+) diphosphatase [Desulfobacterales bacterium]|nr:NAD(+) diphosphatase [Desulfobacterales bacterium]
MDFTASASGPEPRLGKAFYFLFHNRHILVDRDGNIPCLESPADLPVGDFFFFGTLKNLPCYCASVLAENKSLSTKSVNLRAFFLRADDTSRQAAGYARQILDLHLNSKFCGRCGSMTHPKTGEHARVCPECSRTAYPRISPAIITAVTRGDRILLGRGVDFPNPKMFSVLAGFVSPSETLEECVIREVFEETRIRVTDVQYVSSQPWPFPDSLMIGFTARYHSGDICIDPAEIVEADWFSYDDLPLIPDASTLAGRLIRAFVRRKGE